MQLGPLDERSIENESGHLIYFDPAGGGVRDFGGRAAALWARVLEAAPWDTVVHVGAHYGEGIVGVEAPESARVVAVEYDSAVVPYLRLTLREYSREVALVTTGGLADAAGSATRACFRVDTGRIDGAALRAETSALDALQAWAVTLNVEDLDLRRIAGLAREYNMYMVDDRSGSLIRINTSNPSVLENLLASGWLHRADVLLTSTPGLVA